VHDRVTDFESQLPRAATGAEVLLIDADGFARRALRSRLESHGFRVLEAEGASDAIARCVGPEGAAIGAVIADLGGTRELRHLIDSLRAAGRATPVIACGADAVARDCIDWIRAGAVDTLLKPIDPTESVEAIERALQRAALAGTRAVRDRAPRADGCRSGLKSGLESVLGADPRLQQALALARRAGAVRTTVLIEGESGTGKSMLARAIHESSERAGGPFVDLACGSVPETLLESELFGHVKGAFTGALADKKGRFLAAHGGTLFLDEINSATPAMQLKLLRVLQERRFEPVGSDEPVEVDVRVIVASNQPLADLVAAGRFRQDLFYRIHVLPIVLPPLRERPGDARMLASHFLAVKAAELGRTILGFADDALEAITLHAWPGNVRELENAIERAAILCDGPRVELAHLPPSVAARPSSLRRGSEISAHSSGHEDAPPRPLPWTPGASASTVDAAGDSRSAPPRSLADSMREPERRALLAALDAHGWSRTATAKALGINRATLYRKMRDLGIGDARRSA
jgi:DNA-binding NtrC family response regulator